VSVPAGWRRGTLPFGLDLAERQLTVPNLPFRAPGINVSKGLGLFDVCPPRDEAG